MEKIQLLRKVEALLDTFERERAWRTIEIEVREGVPNMIRTSRSEKLISRENKRVSRWQKS
jgi:hypothetical protein